MKQLNDSQERESVLIDIHADDVVRQCRYRNHVVVGVWVGVSMIKRKSLIWMTSSTICWSLLILGSKDQGSGLMLGMWLWSELEFLLWIKNCARMRRVIPCEKFTHHLHNALSNENERWYFCGTLYHAWFIVWRHPEQLCLLKWHGFASLQSAHSSLV